ncbi:MAG TPA: MFS transporter [Candidatus Polarisedimenticolaceae bacterium]|nr:MFS transporter [Candidatus Polarisedimenticolaceae bacterium]
MGARFNLRTLDRGQRRVLGTTCAAHALIHVYELSLPALLLLIQDEFDAGDLEMGGIVMLSALLFGLGALPAGYLVDRLGSKPLLVGCLWGGSLSLGAMAFSPSAPSFAVAAALLGLALSIYHPAGTALITHAIPLSGKVFALHGMAGNLGVAGAGVVAGTLGAAFGWRWAVALLAGCGLLLGGRALLLPAPALQEIRDRSGRGSWHAFAGLLVATMFMGMVYRGLTTFLPKFFAVSFADSRSSGTAVGGALTTLSLLVGLAGMYFAGRMIDRGARASIVFMLGAALQAPFLLIVGSAGPAPLVPLFMAVAFFHFFTQPAGNHLVAEFTPPRLRGLGYGIYFLMTFGAGSLGAVIAGWVSENVGLQSVFPVLAGLLLPSIVAILLVSGVGRRGREPTLSAGGPRREAR